MARQSKQAGAEWVQEKLAAMPDAPGIYFFKNAKGKVLYVGKAKSLRKRVASYFARGEHQLKTMRMVAQARDVEYLVVDSELEALIVEANCIKKYQPRYNVIFKDDKRYPYLKLTLGEPFPKAEFTREIKPDGGRYYGPLSAASVRAMLYLIQNVFQIRDCDLDMAKVHARPCLQYQIKKCSGPCIRAVDEVGYAQQIQGAMKFLEGEVEGVLDALEAEMVRAAGELQYERAAIFRDQIGEVKKFLENQRVVSKQRLDQDFLAAVHVGSRGVGAVVTVRRGKIVGREQYPLTVPIGTTGSQVLEEFVQLYYARASTIPQEVHLPQERPEAPAWEEWLTSLRSQAGHGTGRVRFKAPQRGEPKRLIEMVRRNAELYLHEELKREKVAREITAQALGGLQRALKLPRLPHRIECYDISNLGASNKQRTAVASRVVFLEGKAAKDHYRRYRIKDIDWQDDYAMMRETLLRRLSGYSAPELSEPQTTPAPAKRTPFTIQQARAQAGMGERQELRSYRGDFAKVGHGLWAQRVWEGEELPVAVAPPDSAPEPALEPVVLVELEEPEASEERDERIDLILIDGGKGHLGVALAVQRECGLEGQFEMAGLAKRNEELFVPWLSESILLPEGSPELFLVTQIRDEAHRFANAYRKLLASRALATSELDGIPGIGPTRKAALLKRFGSVKRIREASVKELKSMRGITRELAERILLELNAKEKAQLLASGGGERPDPIDANPYSGS